MKDSRREEAGVKKRIVVVDDHPIVRNGLSLLIGREPDMEVCAEVGNGAEALDVILRLQPDLAILDISIEGFNGLELTKMLHGRMRQLPVLILSMHDETLYADRALRAGARGYLMKHEAPETVLRAIRLVLGGEVFVSERISARMLKDLVDGSGETGGRTGVDRLSDRELEIFERIGRGMSTGAIAEELHLSVKTVEAHRAHIKKKLKLKTAAELARQAVRWVEREEKSP